MIFLKVIKAENSKIYAPVINYSKNRGCNFGKNK